MTTTVLYWPPHQQQVGHVAVDVKGASGSCYVSWWPGEGTKETGRGRLASVVWGVSGERFNLQADIDGEAGRRPIPTVLDGLNELAIIKWWNNEFRLTDWSLLNTNCAQVAVYALRKGEADKYIGGFAGWRASWQASYWKPVEVYNFAQFIRDGLRG